MWGFIRRYWLRGLGVAVGVFFWWTGWDGPEFLDRLGYVGSESGRLMLNIAGIVLVLGVLLVPPALHRLPTTKPREDELRLLMVQIVKLLENQNELTKQQLGARVGASPAVIERAVRGLEAEGKISVSGNVIRGSIKQALPSLAQGTDSAIATIGDLRRDALVDRLRVLAAEGDQPAHRIKEASRVYREGIKQGLKPQADYTGSTELTAWRNKVEDLLRAEFGEGRVADFGRQEGWPEGGKYAVGPFLERCEFEIALIRVFQGRLDSLRAELEGKRP